LFSFSSINDFQARLAKGQTTCLQAVQHYLAAIRAHSPLNAFAEVFEEEALERAAFLDSQDKKGRLHGVVIGIKDNILYKGHRAAAASAILQDHNAVYSATAVERLLAEGAIIIGRQNCDEFGMGSTNENSVYGPVKHPLDADRVPGGSSGGSAVAVKAGLCMVSLGSDTGGSVRLPADFCGVSGYKPSYGRIPRYGLIAYGSSFDVIGILANAVSDIELLLHILAGPDPYDSTALPPLPDTSEKPLYRIAYFPEWLDHPSLDPEIRTALYAWLEERRSEGHTIKPVSFSLTEYIVPTYYILTTAEASSNLSRYDGIRFGSPSGIHAKNVHNLYLQNRTKGFGREVKKRILLGCFVLSTGYYDAYFTRAQQVRRLLLDHTQLIFNEFDFILAPNAPGVAYKKGLALTDPLAMYLGDIFTVFANLTGSAALSLPVFKHSSNLPFGLQLLSSPQNEVPLLRFAHRLMQQ